MIHTIETLKELHEQRFDAVDQAIVLSAEEMSRRLDLLNHHHELAREKKQAILSMPPIFQKSRLRRRPSPAWITAKHIVGDAHDVIEVKIATSR